MLGLACGTERPTAPSGVPARSIITQPPTPPPQPVGQPVATYVFGGPLDHPIRDFTIGSQYLLYEDGVFALRYDGFAQVYLGTYRRDGATISFSFDGHEGATGTFQGDSLAIVYTELMQHSDFENAVYRRSQ